VAAGRRPEKPHPNNDGRCGHIANSATRLNGGAGRGIGEASAALPFQSKALGIRSCSSNAVVRTNRGALRLTSAWLSRLGVNPGVFRMETGTGHRAYVSHPVGGGEGWGRDTARRVY
jgi:hypothetical protein